MSWADGIRQIHDQAGGLLNLLVIQPDDMARFIGRAMAGDPDADRVVTMVSEALQGIQQAPRARPMLCGSCPRPLRKGRYSVVAAIPARDDPSQGLTLAICHRCATDKPGVEQKAVIALRRLWPDSRSITITDPKGGHA